MDQEELGRSQHSRYGDLGSVTPQQVYLPPKSPLTTNPSQSVIINYGSTSRQQTEWPTTISAAPPRRHSKGQAPVPPPKSPVNDNPASNEVTVKAAVHAPDEDEDVTRRDSYYSQMDKPRAMLMSKIAQSRGTEPDPVVYNQTAPFLGKEWSRESTLAESSVTEEAPDQEQTNPEEQEMNHFSYQYEGHLQKEEQTVLTTAEYTPDVSNGDVALKTGQDNVPLAPNYSFPTQPLSQSEPLPPVEGPNEDKQDEQPRRRISQKENIYKAYHGAPAEFRDNQAFEQPSKVTQDFGYQIPVDDDQETRFRKNQGVEQPSKNTSSSFGYQIPVEEDEGASEGIGCCGYILTGLSWFLIVITFPFSLCLGLKVVQEYERAVIFRLGRLLPGGAKGPGLFFIVPCTDSYTKVDLRTVSFDVPPQEILSKDSVTVAVDAVVYYRISNATISITNVEDANRSTRLLAQTTLRNVLGTKNLSEILSDREQISHFMQSSLDEATDPWGVKVERVEVKDVRLPVQLQRAMAAEAEATREARAKVIAAEGEQKASRALKDAADIISESGAALQLRYLQTLSTISAEKNSTIIFPLPIDVMQGFMKK